MAHSQFDLFLKEATYLDQASESTLDRDRLYGLYTSWCHVTAQRPQTEAAFWAAMRRRVGPQANGLQMKGAAAADYILCSYPALV